MKAIIIILVVVILALIVGVEVWLWWTQNLPVPLQEILPTPPVGAVGDTTGAINQALGAIDLGNLDDEFKAINQDINAL